MDDVGDRLGSSMLHGNTSCFWKEIENEERNIKIVRKWTEIKLNDYENDYMAKNDDDEVEWWWWRWRRLETIGRGLAAAMDERARTCIEKD